MRQYGQTFGSAVGKRDCCSFTVSLRAPYSLPPQAGPLVESL